MCASFLATWSPYAIVAMMYVSNHADKVPIALEVAAPLSAKSATFLHPIIYFLAVKRFREDTSKVLQRFLKKKENILLSRTTPDSPNINTNMVVSKTSNTGISS